MSKIELMPMQTRHVSSVAALEQRCFAAPWSERSVAGELENPLSRWLVAEQDGVLVGYIGSQSVGAEADMMNVAVAPEARRQGVAQKLLDALWTELKRNGVTSLTLEVRASNAPALELYEKNGFQQIGRRKNYYHHPREDALILQKREEEI